MTLQTAFPAFPICTRRLRLRPFTEQDFDDLHGFQALPVAARYSFTEPSSREETHAQLNAWLACTAFAGEGDKLMLAMEKRHHGGVIGRVSLTLRGAQERQGEIGFLLHPDFHGQGLGYEACLPLMRLGFEHFGLHLIYGRCDARNVASARLMEKLGLRREEIVKGTTGELVFALLAREWAERRRAGRSGR